MSTGLSAETGPPPAVRSVLELLCAWVTSETCVCFSSSSSILSTIGSNTRCKHFSIKMWKKSNKKHRKRIILEDKCFFGRKQNKSITTQTINQIAVFLQKAYITYDTDLNRKWKTANRGKGVELHSIQRNIGTGDNQARMERPKEPIKMSNPLDSV